MEKQRNPFPLPVGRTGLLLVLITASLAAASSTQRDKVHVYSLTEEQPPDTFVANLLIDSGLAARYSANILSTLTFVFLKEVENLELFVLDPLNGILRTGRSVDRDVICPGQLNCALRLDIAVQPPAYFEVIKVELTIVDINDNAPKFDSPRHHLVVSEATPPGERFRLPGAVDVDSVPNGVVEYHLLSTTSAFQLDVTQDPAGGSRPKDVWLVLLEDLDREREDRFELLVAGYDGGVPRRSAILTVDVHVEDVNDNVPKFDRSAYNVSVSESTPIGATVVRVFASDADVGRNGHVRYRFSQRSGANYGDLFAVDPESGDVVLLQALDHAAAASYSLGVVAEDQGEFASPALAALVVSVVDINDHAPQIVVDVLSAGGSVEVAENADPGTFVAHVSTLDKDAGDNGLVRCSINDNNNFRLTSIYDGEYKLVTAAAFDRETVTRFDVVIRCHDMGEPRRHVSKVVIVNVADVNDNCPVFTHAVYEAAVDENQPPGSFVVRVSAHDPDAGSNGDVVYLLDSDADQRFHVDSASGVVTVLTTLDREAAVADAAETIEFHVLAANRGESGGPMMARAAVRVRVADVDDEPPRFRSDRYVMAVAENLPPRTEVGRVTAVDGDLPPFNAFSFLLSNNSSSNSRTFAIDPRLGTIFTKRSLDREKQSHYDVTVEVVSNTVAVTRDVTRVAIDVIDANDNAPNVTFPNEFDNTVSVASTVKVHEVVCTVRGHDLDLGSNSELVYEVIDGNGTTFFGVDPLNGHVTSLRDLVRSVNETYTLVLRVRDSGTPVQYSTATLHVAVTDGNQSPISAVAAENQWTWLLADARLLVIAGVVVAICLVFVAILATAILLVRRRSRRRRAKVQLAMMKTEMVTMQGRKDDDDNDDGDSINQMKMMMNDGKMVRMKDVSFTELNTNAPCITGKQFSGVSGSGYGRETKLSARLHHVTSVGPPVTFDAETDSGCADVSHCNDDLSSGSERSNKEVETGLKDRTLSCNDRRLPQCSNASQKSKLDAHSSNHVMPSHVTSPFASGCCVKNDGKLSASVSPFRSSQSPSSSSSSSSSTSLPMSSTLLSANRKSVRFADDDDDDRKFVTLDDSKSNELCKRERNQNGGVDQVQPLPLCSNSNRPEASDVIGKIPTYAHQYPTHVGMTTFLPDDGSLV